MTKQHKDDFDFLLNIGLRSKVQDEECIFYLKTMRGGYKIALFLKFDIPKEISKRGTMKEMFFFQAA